jgi:hypothetical protein
MKWILLFSAVFFPFLVLAEAPKAHAPPPGVMTSGMIVRGVVVSFDKDKIVLRNGKSLINVPRSAYPNLKKVIVGHSVIEVRMTPKENQDLNP